jgi:CRP/FNR family transcriptional regulator
MNRGRIVEVEADQLIVSRNSRSTDMYMVMSGYVLLQTSSVQGRQFVVDLIKPGQLFGFAAFLGSTVERLDAIALTPNRLAALDPASLERAIEENPGFALKLVRYFVQRLQRRTQQVEDLVMLSFSSRLAKWLLGLAREQGVRVEKGASFQCEFSQTLIAMLVGVSRETVSRQLQKWEDRGLLTHEGKVFYILDPMHLQRIADGFSDSE